jgi:short-subunit dehydrogenase
LVTDTVLIIGAGSGLSASLARRFAAGGNDIVLASRSTDDLKQLAKELEARVISCDAAKKEDVSALFAQIDETGASLTTVIYNAGLYLRGSITDLDPSDVERVISINAYGAFLAAQESAVRMKKAGRGVMLFTGASAGVKGYANSAAFAMGKFALRGLCQSLARELAPQSIHVAHFVIDGLIYSPERGSPFDDADICLNPDDIAESYFQIAQQDRSAWTWEIELRPYVETF